MITVLQNGQQADRRLLNETLKQLNDQGTSILDSLSLAYEGSLINLQRRLSATNARRQRANRSQRLRTLARIDLTDFQDLDQSKTTATVRIDARSATLRERNVPRNLSVASTIFTSDRGSINTFGDLYQVYVSDSDASPTGTFTIELFSAVQASLILFDIVATPSRPTVTVQVSTDGASYSDATAVNMEGYRISAFFPETRVKFIKLQVTPSHADNIDGSTFTFGITDINISAVQFQLSSELYSRPILITPSSSKFLFVPDSDPGILFYLSINNGAYSQFAAGDTIAVPGASDITASDIGLVADSNGKLNITLPEDIYPLTLSATDSDGAAMPILPGLDPGAAGVSGLQKKYLAVNGTAVFLVPYSADDASKTFNLSYTHGPASITVQLRAVITEADRSKTPIFRGAVFQEI